MCWVHNRTFGDQKMDGHKSSISQDIALIQEFKKLDASL